MVHQILKTNTTEGSVDFDIWRTINTFFVQEPKPNMETAFFACGCFWSKEFFFSQVPGVISTRVGYTGGHSENPTYKTVCARTTGHAEAVEVNFDSSKVTFEELTKQFFEIHDPTIDRTGHGGQYRSAIFYKNEEQLKIAEQLIKQLHANGFEVKTQLEKADTFWEAEERHQKYCEVKGLSPKEHYVERFQN